MSTFIHNHDDLVENYLDVYNKALQNNGDRFPFKQILGAVEREGFGKIIEIQLIDAVPPEIHVMAYSKNGLYLLPSNDVRGALSDGIWNVKIDDLKNVVQNPDTYIQNPAKLDWEWVLSKA